MIRKLKIANYQLLSRLILVSILILAAILRFYRLDEYPALNADEAAIGYNAYSLIQTGKDEHGNPWPVHFQSFNDYKPGGYFYITAPFIYFFGLNEWSVRFPGAMFGVFTVFAVYLLTKQIIKNVNGKYVIFPILAALLLSISPWHIHFSRGGWEVNVATFFITLGVFLFLKSIVNPNIFVFSALSFVLSLYTYHAARVVVPLFCFALFLIYRKKLFSEKNMRLFAGSLIFGFILLIPLVSNFFGENQSRASGVSLFADRGYIDRINEARGRFDNPNGLIARALYNKPKEITLEFSRNYFEHFWGEFLFLSGDDIQRNKVPEFGLLYLWQFPLLIAAMFSFANKQPSKMGIILIWLAIAPIPASLTFQSPHALRAQNMVIPLTILSAYGLAVIINFLKENIKIKTLLGIFYFLLVVVLTWSLSRYLHQYWVHMAKTFPYSSQYGVKELVDYLKNTEAEEVIITTRYDQPYILFLFYLKYPPQLFQKNHTLTERDKFGFSTVPVFDRYLFKSIDFENDKLKYPNALIVGTEEEIPNTANIIKNIYGSNGLLYFQVVKN